MAARSPFDLGPLVLASSSPRRLTLLRTAGISFEQVVPDGVDESIPAGAEPTEAVRLIAERKVRAAVPLAPGRLVLAADTLVFLDREPLGKPADGPGAERMLARLSGRTHEVATGVALCGPAVGGDVRTPVLESGSAVARVRFRRLSDEEIRAYVAGGEPLDKAGAYAIQGGAAGFVEHLEGDEETVIGLPIRLVRRLLARFDEPQDVQEEPGSRR